MNYTPEQISSIVLKVLKEIETPDVSSLSREEKLELAKNPNYKKQTLELTSTQHEALKKLIESGQDESLKGLMDT